MLTGLLLVIGFLLLTTVQEKCKENIQKCKTFITEILAAQSESNVNI
jgi:hypothetical protein